MGWVVAPSPHRTEVGDELESTRAKPLKRRGLSRHYSSKSQSFSSMELVLLTPYGESALALSKTRSSTSEEQEQGTTEARAASPERFPLQHQPSSLRSCSYDLLMSHGSPQTVSVDEHEHVRPQSTSVWSPSQAMMTEVMCDHFLQALKVNNLCRPPSPALLNSVSHAQHSAPTS